MAHSSVRDQPARTILVVDDDPLLRGVLVRVLERRGHRVWAVDAVAPALETLATVRIDAAVIDLGVPGDGATVVRYLDGDPSFAGVLIAMSGRIPIESGDDGLGRRAIRLKKPFKLEELLALIEGGSASESQRDEPRNPPSRAS